MTVSERMAALVDGFVAGLIADATAPLQAQVGELQWSLQRANDRISELEAEIVELTKPADPDGWVSIYDSTFAVNDGWVARAETQANDASYNTPSNVGFGDGMVLLGRRENMGARAYTSADVLGKHVRVPNYFRADVTATLPTEAGQWPCPLWFRPLTGGDTGEIDVCETWPFDWAGGAVAHSTIWENYNSKRKQNAGLPYAALPNPDPTAPHTYSVIKTPGRIEFLIDDVRVYCWDSAVARYNATERTSPLPDWYAAVYENPEREWYPRVTLQIGGPNAKEPLPEWQESRMVIHRLRIFKEA